MSEVNIEQELDAWPERRWPCVNVLCEGPSILEFDSRDLLLGPVVAINHALSVPAKAHVWATTDVPRNLWEWSTPYRRQGLRFLTVDTALAAVAGAWNVTASEEELSRVYAVEPTEMFTDAQGIPVILPTLMPTLAWLLKLEVKRVRIFGCDMSGEFGPLSQNAYVSEEGMGWTWRWNVERVLLSHMMRLYRAHGARIERWKPLARSRKRPTAPV